MFKSFLHRQYLRWGALLCWVVREWGGWRMQTWTLDHWDGGSFLCTRIVDCGQAEKWFGETFSFIFPWLLNRDRWQFFLPHPLPNFWIVLWLHRRGCFPPHLVGLRVHRKVLKSSTSYNSCFDHSLDSMSWKEWNIEISTSSSLVILSTASSVRIFVVSTTAW